MKFSAAAVALLGSIVSPSGAQPNTDSVSHWAWLDSERRLNEGQFPRKRELQAGCATPCVEDFSSGFGFHPGVGGCPDVTVSCSGTLLYRSDIGLEANGRAPVCFGGDANFVTLSFSEPVNFVSVSFGNDDPDFSDAGDVARLSSGPYVNEVTMNRDDIMNQDISLHTPGSTSFDFIYAAPGGGGGINLIEVIDDLVFCPGISNKNGAGMGDPHFKSWSNQWYDFHGVCDLVFAKASEFANGLGIDIHVRTKPRYEYSFIESAAIKIGNDVLEVGSWGQYFVNGVSNADLPFSMGEGKYTVIHEQINANQHVFKIQMGDSTTEDAIVIKTHKDMVNINIENASYTNWKNASGMLGRFCWLGMVLLSWTTITYLVRNGRSRKRWTASCFKLLPPTSSVSLPRTFSRVVVVVWEKLL